MVSDKWSLWSSQRISISIRGLILNHRLPNHWKQNTSDTFALKKNFFYMGISVNPFDPWQFKNRCNGLVSQPLWIFASVISPLPSTLDTDREGKTDAVHKPWTKSIKFCEIKPSTTKFVYIMGIINKYYSTSENQNEIGNQNRRMVFIFVPCGLQTYT